MRELYAENLKLPLLEGEGARSQIFPSFTPSMGEIDSNNPFRNDDFKGNLTT